MEIDKERIDEAAPALLYLGPHQGVRAWKGFDWAVVNRLYEKDFISNPVGRTKPIVFASPSMVAVHP